MPCGLEHCHAVVSLFIFQDEMVTHLVSIQAIIASQGSCNLLRSFRVNERGQAIYGEM